MARKWVRKRKKRFRTRAAIVIYALLGYGVVFGTIAFMQLLLSLPRHGMPLPDVRAAWMEIWEPGDNSTSAQPAQPAGVSPQAAQAAQAPASK
jgi:hypothetical protein